MNDKNSGRSVTAGCQPIIRHLSYYAVLYLDLLGQRQAIAELEDLTLLRDDQRTYYRRFGEAAGKVWGVRGFLEQNLANSMATALASAGYTTPPITIQMFADAVMAYFPYDEKNPNSFVALYSLLVATAETMIHALAGEVPIRGGLDVHIATEFKEPGEGVPSSHSPINRGGDIWGPAPKRAYELGEKQAEYPRILIGDGVGEMVLKLAENISEKISNHPGGTAPASAVEAAKRSVPFVTRDPVDEKLILDYLGPGLRETCDPEFHEVLRKAARFAVAEHKRFSASGDNILAKRYLQLLHYMQSRQEPHGRLPAGSIPVITPSP